MTVTKNAAAIYAALNPPVLLDCTRVIRRVGWYQLLSPGIKEPSINEVLMSQVADEDVEQSIELAFSSYAEHELPFKWAIGPMSNQRIESRIAERAEKSWSFRGMSFDTSQELAMPGGVFVDLVDDTQREDYVKINLNAWGLEQQSDLLKAKYEAMVSHPRYRCYVVKKDGLTIGTGTTLIQSGYGYLLGAVILEAYRGFGAYRALVARRLSDLKKEQISFAVTQAKELSSVPILSRLGFATEYHAKIYQFTY